MAIESQWVTFRIGQELFGFEIQYVKEMLRLPEVHPVPHAAPDNLGVVLLRSEVIPVFDLTKRFGVRSSQQAGNDLASSLHEHLKDHENWMHELEACVSEQRDFTLTTDPSECPFGGWFDTFTTDDHTLRRTLQAFDAPHKEIHAIGADVQKCMMQGKHDAALRLVQRLRSTVFPTFARLFEEAISEIEDHARQSLIIVGTSCRTIGVAVDEIHIVIRCEDDQIQPPDSIPGIEEFPGLIGLLPQKNSKKFIMLLDPAAIYPQLIQPQTSAPSAAASQA